MPPVRDVALGAAPSFDPRAHEPRHLKIAARTWNHLLAQEERSFRMASRLVGDLERLGAPRAILDDARRVASDESRHVELCAGVVRAFGFDPAPPVLDLPTLPVDDARFERAMAEILVAGFAVGETMSVGGFIAVREVAREPLVRWAYAILARDEVRHGLFGEVAGAWALRGWTPERKRALWPVCVAAMEGFEQRVGGPAGEHAQDTRSTPLEALGAPNAGVTATGLLGSVPKWVLPRLARLGVLPEVPRR